MITPQTTIEQHQKRTVTEQDPFQMSESASIVQGSDKGSGANLLSSQFGSSYNKHNASMNLSNLIWQLPYSDRKSLLMQQQKQIQAAAYSEDLKEDEIGEVEDFEVAEDTDLNEEELDLNVSRKMSIRALNVATMHRFSPGSITDGTLRTSLSGIHRFDANVPPRPTHKPSLLLRASNQLLQRSTLNRASRLSQLRVSNLMNLKQHSAVSGRDSTFDVSVEEEDAIPGIIGMSVHRCSMIKKYNIETFFSPAKMHRRTVTETQPLHPISSRARFEPVDPAHPSNIDQSVQISCLPDKIVEEDDE